jgi:pimeloyl-ACP methyl ester carboxylesterase
MKEKQILINGLKINYKIAGEGPAVLILHGWGGSSDSWRKVQRILAKEKYKVIVPDLPGFGKSITPPEPWQVKDYSNLILNLTEKLGTSQFFLLGHSFGGRIAIKFAKDHPQKIKKLILSGSAGIKQKWGLKEKLIFQLSKLGNAIFTPTPLIRLKDKARNLFYIFLRHKDYVKADGTMKETVKKVLSEDLLPELSQIKTKTLLVWGQRDKMVPLKYAYIFKENISNSKLEILPKIGHSPNLEAPEKLSGIILDFLED